MPRSRDSDEDYESKAVTRNQARLLVPSMNSPLRRSSRLKQSKHSPDSESDSSISSNQTTRSARMQAANIDLDGMKKTRTHTRKISTSSEISEVDVESLGTPKKRITRQSGSLVGTPVRITTRAASKRFTRSGSEAKSPIRITRSTRASSVDPESFPNQSKSQSSTPIKTRRRASMLPLSSLSKEKVELKDRVPYVKLDATIVETDEITTSGNSDSSPDKALRNTTQSEKNKKRQSLEKDEIDENSSQIEILNDSKSEILELSEEKDEKQPEDLDSVTVKNAENIIAGETSADSFNSLSQKDGKSQSVRKKLLDLEESLVDICVSTQIETVPENLSDISNEEQKSNKENQMLNIISNMSPEKSMPEVIPSSGKSSPILSKSSNEKEAKSTKKELNSSKRRYSRASTEIAIKHNDLLKETADSSPEKMDISVDSSSPIAINKSVSSQYDNTELADEVTNKDKSIENLFTLNEDTEMIRKSDKIDKIKGIVDSKDSNKTESNEEDEILIENVNMSTSEGATEMISESDKIDKIEDTVVDSKDSNQMESNEEDKISCLAQSKQMYDSRESLISATDDNEMKLTLEERSPSREKNEVLLNLTHSKPDGSADLQTLSPINKGSDDQATTMNKSTQDKVIDSSDTEQEQENLPIHEELDPEPASSNAVLKTNNSERNNSNDETIQDNKFFDTIKTFKTSAMDKSPKKVDTEDCLLEKRAKRSLKRKSMDNLTEEKNSKIITTQQKDQEDMEIADNDSDVNAGIDLFQDIPADKWKEKNDVKTPVQATSQSAEEVENETDSCELLLANKEAWLAAESMKAAKVTESFECDSDDTVDMLWKSQSDASRMNYSTEKSETSSNADLMDIDDEKNKKQIKRKSRTDKKLTTEIDQDSPQDHLCAEDEDNLVNTDESLNESKTTLNRINKLNESVRSARTKRPSFKANKDSKDEFKYENEDIEHDLSESNRRSLISKKNIPLHKSMERTSLNKSSKDTFVQSDFTKKVDNSEEKPDNTDARTEKKLDQKKHSLSKSYNKEADNDATKFEKNMLTKSSSKKKEKPFLNRSVDQESKSENIEKMIHFSNDESDDSDVNIAVMDLGSTTYSMIANVGSNNEDSKDSEDSEDSDDSDDQQEHYIPSFLFAKARSDSDDDSSSDSDIKREYNLDGVEQKFSDDDAVADECRDSEVEFSDSDDNGSDLEDFIVDDDEIELEEEEEEDDSNEDNDDEDVPDLQEDDGKEEDEENKQVHMKLNSMETEKEEDDEQENDEGDTVNEEDNENELAEIKAISSKDAIFHKKLSKVCDNKNQTAKHTLPRTNETEMDQDIKMKKSNLKKKEKTNLLDSSNSNLSIEKKKSLAKENETILPSNIISSLIEKRRKSDPQYFSKNNAERRYSSGQLNEFEMSMPARKLSKHISLEFSTPKLNTSKKLGLDKTLERSSESKNKSDMIKVMQTSAMKEKSNEGISLRLFNDADKEKMSTSDFSPDLLELLKNTHFSKSTPSKKESRKTMNIHIETPTIKHLRKEKLNESAPILTSNKKRTEICSLQKQLFIKNKDNAQTKVKEENNEHEVPEILSDDIIQTKLSKQKKHKEQESSKENISNKALSEDITEVNVPKKKKRVKLSQLTVVKDNCEDVLTTSEIQKRRNKLFARHDVILENTYDFVQKQEEKQEKKKRKLKEDITENAGELKISKKKKRANLDKLVTVQNITDKALSEDVNVISKKKKRVKFPQLAIADNIHKDICPSIEKIKKKKKRDTSKENIADKASSENLIKINVPKKKKRVKLAELDIVKDNTLEDECQIIEKKKKKRKKKDTSKDDSIDKAEDIEINIPKKKDAHQINEKQKKKKNQGTSKEAITGKALFEDAAQLKIPKKKKKKLAIVQNDIPEDTYEFNQKKKRNIKLSDIKVMQYDDILKDALEFTEKLEEKRKQKPKEYIAANASSKNVGELKISKKKKHANLNKLVTVQNNTSEDACQIIEREKKKKKKRIDAERNINEDAMFQKIVQNSLELQDITQHKKKKPINLDSPVNKQKKLVKKKAKRQETVPSIETLRTEKKKHTLPIQIPVSKLKSEKMLMSNKLQKIALGTSESKDVIYSTKKLEEAAKSCMTKELNTKKKRRFEDTENEIHSDLPIKKSKKEVKEVNKFLPSSSGVKRLSNDVIDYLTDVPTKTKKKQKFSPNEKISSVKNKSKAATVDRDDLVKSSTSGCTTQFRIINVQDTKKPMKTAAVVASFRQRMLARNEREPTSTYLIYQEKNRDK